jgi:hypothetical protein
MKKLYGIIALLVWSSNSFAQFPYNMYVLNETYTDLENPILLTTGPWDDPVLNVPIGFDFSFFNTVTNNLYISGLGGTLSIEPVENMPFDLILVYQSDIIDIGTLSSEMLSPISFKVEGDPGSRICKIEWKNVGFYNEIAGFGTAYNTANIQCWLYEGSNDIDFRFGPNTIKQDDIAHDGFGPWMGFVDGFVQETQTFNALYSLQGDPSNPGIASWTELPATPEEFVFLSDDPINGTVYKFTTGVLSVEKPAILSINKPSFSLYPQPAQSEVQIKWDQSNPNAIIEFFDLTGNKVKHLQSNESLTSVSLNDLSSGIYIVRATSAFGEWSQKLIKE